MFEDDGTFVPWKPELPESLDGKPLATTILDLFWNFPYDRLPENRVVANSLRPGVVIVMIAFYLTSKGPLQDFCQFFNITGKSESFKLVVALHNAILQVFSLVVALNSWPIVVSHYREHGFMSGYCNQNGTLWNESGFGAWATIFYLSKFYEFLDTWFLVMKGKKPSFLQVYHHAGIIFTIWGGVASQGAWLQVVVLLNSIIHTLMYTYFFIKTMFPQVQIKMAKYLTQAQIGQFIIGIFYTGPTLFMGDSCDSQSARLMLLISHAYACGLIFLFVKFAVSKYQHKKA